MTKLKRSHKGLGLAIAVSGCVGATYAAAAGKPTIPADGQRMFLLGQDQVSIQDYMADASLPRPHGLTMYTTLTRGATETTTNYCFKGLDGLKNIDNYNSYTADGCSDSERRNQWGSGIQNAQWAIETYQPEVVALGMFCPGNGQAQGLAQNGTHDDLLIELSDFFKEHQNTSFFLRTCYEFNGDAHGLSADAFRSIYKYVKTFLDEQGVSNVAHVWQSDAFHGTGRVTNQALGNQEQGYWPGKQYVDWVGVSQFASDINEEAEIAEIEGLPLFVAEVTPHGDLGTQYDFGIPFNSSQGVAQGTANPVTIVNNLDWFTQKNAEIVRPSTKAWHYINADWTSQPQWESAADQAGANFFKYTDSRIQQSTDIKDYFTEFVSEENGFLLAGSESVPIDPADPTVPVAPVEPSEPTTTTLQAENGVLSGDAQVFDDAAAQGGQGVAYIYTPNSGVAFENAPAADELTLYFASMNSGTISIYVNGTDNNVAYSGTGSWAGTYRPLTTSIEVPAGATVKVGFDSGDAALNLDRVDFTSLGSTAPEVPTEPEEPIEPEQPTEPAAPETPVTPAANFGFAYVDDTTMRVYHVDNGWTASWNYMCVNGDCRAATRSEGVFYREVSAVIGTTYQIEFKVQDDAVSQFIVGDSVTFEASSGAPTQPEVPVEPEEPSEPEVPVEPEEPFEPEVPVEPTEPETPVQPAEQFGIAYVDDSTMRVYHVDKGWTASWNYICVNSDCRAGTRENGLFYRDVPAMLGTTYELEFKAQDDVLSQVMVNKSATFTANAGTPTDPADPTEPTDPTDPTNPGEPTPAATVAVVNDTTLGNFLVAGADSDLAGFTLYTFDVDAGGPSQCNGVCAGVWPPYTVASEDQLVAPAGVTLGSSLREDGSLQVTLDGDNLYFYVNDSQPSDTVGHGVNGVWFVADLPTPDFADLTWQESALPMCSNLYSNNIPTFGYHTYIEGTDLVFRAGSLLASEVWGNGIRAVFFRTNGASGQVEHIGTVEGSRNGDSATLSIPSEYLEGQVSYYVSYERFFTPMSDPGKTGNALEYADSALYALNRTEGCVSGNWTSSGVEDFAGWTRRQHPQGVFNDHNVFAKSTSSIQNSATHFMHVPRFVVSVAQDQVGQDLIFNVVFTYEAESPFQESSEIIFSGIEGKGARAGDGSPLHSYSFRCDQVGPNEANCNAGQVFSYGQNVDWELRVQPVGGAGANLYSQMFYYVPGHGWARESVDPRALLGGEASIDAHGATVYERSAAFMQHQHTDDLQQVRDFVRQHQDLRDPIGTPQHGAQFDTCESCHINDGRSDTVFTLPNGHQRIAPPLIGLGLLEQVVDFPGKVGFGWEGSRDSVEAAVRFALEADFGVPNPDAGLVDKLTHYSQLVGVPQRDKSTMFDPSVIAGEALFKGKMQCIACHQETLQLTNGDVIRPYTDMKAHDLGDGSFRTAPLWGIGRSANVVLVSMEADTGMGFNNAQAPGIAQRTLGASEAELRQLGDDRDALFMHDGRAQGLDEAVRVHGGEAATASQAYQNASSQEREQLLSFLRSL
ncbi:family 31 carbohydrate-binding protein [Echinimonas agarilytica]|uniref:Family 31 carbohydrate-binding protein n=1 Tax=Echinimonas agarilytica TaxID=1215918 RepID=A0AA42B998_9GAMM|nr:family 31 carbohydrate-binding protein [Echinimonas agarilytica]MCM2681308.1 family 31 carbohydrate-binding protein [Echinimonas agarilytica]